VLEWVTMALYSLLLACVLTLGSPYWLWRMARGGAGRSLAARLGRVPRELRAAVAGRQVVWVHTVSVGEVLAAVRLVAELERVLGDGWRIVVSTTTATGQALARQRFAGGKDAGAANGAGRVFYYPLDFAWAVRAYLRALKPRMLVLMESELWPRMLVECGRAGVPVAVVNARVSDRSFARGMRVRSVWGRLLRRVDLFLTQSEEDARRLVTMGANAGAVRAVGNLKYDAAEPKQSKIADLVREAAAGRPIVVVGSTSEGNSVPDGRTEDEEKPILRAWTQSSYGGGSALLVLAPRHPERFGYVETFVSAMPYCKASAWRAGEAMMSPVDLVLLDTIGDLAAAYGVADVAFVGGSLVTRGGHNPLEPARFGVPVVMGPSYENFRDIVAKMRAAGGIRIVQDDADLERALTELLADPEAAKAMGERGRRVFEQQQGATGRAVEALFELVGADDRAAAIATPEAAR